MNAAKRKSKKPTQLPTLLFRVRRVNPADATKVFLSVDFSFATERSMTTVKMTNVTFAEIQIGATARMSRTLSQTELEVLALLSGDIDPFVLQGNGVDEIRPDASVAEAAGAEALIAALLGTRLPGPGMKIVRQDLSFQGTVHVGDVLTATVGVIEKREESNEVVFDCRCVDQQGFQLVGGTVTVVAPTKRVTYDEVAPPEL